MQVSSYPKYTQASFHQPLQKSLIPFQSIPEAVPVCFGMKTPPGVTIVSILVALISPLLFSKPTDAQERNPLIEPKEVFRKDEKKPIELKPLQPSQIQPSTTVSAAKKTSKLGTISQAGEIVVTIKQRYQFATSPKDKDTIYVLNKFGHRVGSFNKADQMELGSIQPKKQKTAKQQNGFSLELRDPDVPLPGQRIEIVTQKHYGLVESAKNPKIIYLVESDAITGEDSVSAGSFYKEGTLIFNERGQMVGQISQEGKAERINDNSRYGYGPSLSHPEEAYQLDAAGYLTRAKVGDEEYAQSIRDYESIQITFPENTDFGKGKIPFTTANQLSAAMALFEPYYPTEAEQKENLKRITELFLGRHSGTHRRGKVSKGARRHH